MEIDYNLPIPSVDLCSLLSKNEHSFLANEKKETRQTAVERYLKFLQLAKKYPKRFLVPTEDIDDVWHTHMLSPRAYMIDCLNYFGYIFDHNAGFGSKDDKEYKDLLDKYANTSNLWKLEYCQKYETSYGLKVCGGGDGY